MTAPRIYPTLRYDDAPKAIAFLVDAFGFVRHEVHEGEDGTIDHAQLAYDTGLVMLSSRRGDGDKFEATRMALYVAVDDPDAHHAQAVAAGAEIIMELTDQPYGSREYAAVDPEGNAWSFGTYRPAVS
jgi:uncharacterized glyoxalase superfamily protein PhnB